MKITRLRSGYIIRLSDSDFDLIWALVSDGESRSIFESEDDAPLSAAGYTPAVQSAYTRRTKGGDLMRVDEDRRRR